MESLHYVTGGHAASHMPNVGLKAKKWEVQCTRDKHATHPGIHFTQQRAVGDVVTSALLPWECQVCGVELPRYLRTAGGLVQRSRAEGWLVVTVLNKNWSGRRCCKVVMLRGALEKCLFGRRETRELWRWRLTWRKVYASPSAIPTGVVCHVPLQQSGELLLAVALGFSQRRSVLYWPIPAPLSLCKLTSLQPKELRLRIASYLAFWKPVEGMPKGKEKALAFFSMLNWLVTCFSQAFCVSSVVLILVGEQTAVSLVLSPHPVFQHIFPQPLSTD